MAQGRFAPASLLEAGCRGSTRPSHCLKGCYLLPRQQRASRQGNRRHQWHEREQHVGGEVSEDHGVEQPHDACLAGCG